MNCFGDIVKNNNCFDDTFNTTISRFHKTNANNVLITESVHLVANYDTTDGLVPIESWSFPQLNRLSLAVISCEDVNKTKTMIAIQEPNSLTKWSFGQKKSRTEKHFFNTKIIGLIGFDVQNGQTFVEPIVVYDKGFCQLMSNAIKSRREDQKPVVIGDDESIQFIDGLVNKTKDNLILYLITKSIETNEPIIKSIYKLTLNIRTDVIVKTDRQSLTHPMTNWSLCRQTETIFSVHRSDNELTVYSLNGKTETKLFKLKSSSIESVIGLGTTTAGSVCLIGRSDDSNYLMELWESRFGSKLGSIDLPSEPLRNDCKVIDNTIFITCLNSLLLIPIITQTISLSQMIGDIKDTSIESRVEKQLEEICEDFKTCNEKSIDEINERFTELVDQMSGSIPEDVIIKLLITFSAKVRETKCQSFERFFEKLISFPFNDIFMISKLKTSGLKSEQIVCILRLLSQLLPSNNCLIIDWISLLIDSHINAFILNPNEEMIELIAEIETKIDCFSQLCEHLGEIKSLFEIILAKDSDKILPNRGLNLPKPKRGQYCIEILRF